MKQLKLSVDCKENLLASVPSEQNRKQKGMCNQTHAMQAPRKVNRGDSLLLPLGTVSESQWMQPRDASKIHSYLFLEDPAVSA